MAKKEKIESFNLYNPYKLALGEDVEFPSSRNLKEYGNRVYNRYPARSIFLVPRATLSHQDKEQLNILDPFMGSGTTAVETVISGNIPFGLEMDPFARMVAEVSSSIFSNEELREISNTYNQIIANWQDYKGEPIPALTGIERWFKPGDLDKLLKLKSAIIDMSPIGFRDFFLVTFADAIKPVSLMERQSLKPYISTRYTKVTKSVQESFEYSFNAHILAMQEMTSCGQPRRAIKWLGDDATNFSNENLIDLAITSPPYINALDYTRCIKVESALCGTINNTIANGLREKQVGHEKRRKQNINNIVSELFQPYYDGIFKLDKQRAETCRAYFNDMYKNLQCVFKALKKAGEYHIIIGDNTIKGIDIPTHDLVRSLAQTLGYEFFGHYCYEIKDHRTSIPRNKKNSKIEYEHVIMLRKS